MKFQRGFPACISCLEYKILSHPCTIYFVGIKIKILQVKVDQVHLLHIDIINSNSEQLRNYHTQKTKQNWQGGYLCL